MARRGAPGDTDHDISQRQARRLVGVDPKNISASVPAGLGGLPQGDAREITGKRRRFGCRRFGMLLERKVMNMNHKKLNRIYREEGLSVLRRRDRK